jgi:DNA-binding MarR family transcriptional regulator
MSKSNLKKDIKEFHDTIINLIKKYQFRDRNQITRFGISVSQCYVLETIHSNGSLTMKELSQKMHLSISTITRVVDQLENKNLVTREQNPKDLRIRLLTLTKEGEKTFLQSWKRVFESEKEIFENIPTEYRKELLTLLKELNKAVDIWQDSCKSC